MSKEENNITAARLLGIPDKRTAADPNLEADNKAPATAWEIYNNRAFTHDKELIKDWNDTLNTLLVFAALYSAVLTAFIIESMKLLKEDVAETTRAILLTISTQLANTSTLPFQPLAFNVPPYAVHVNRIFFVSISASLIAALGSVLALQWVGSYDYGLNSSSPKDRALQRHFRYMGIEKWRMRVIIAFLPTLLFLSLLLFLAGLAIWLFHIHTSVSAVIIVAVIIAFLFFITTTILGILYPDAPFRTPISNFLLLLLHATSNLLKRGISYTPLLKGNSKAPPQGRYSFQVREEKAIQEQSDGELGSLLWVVQSISVLPHARETLQILVKEITELPIKQLQDPRINSAPWASIFTMLCQPYFNKRKREDYSEEELNTGSVSVVAKGIAMIGSEPFGGDLVKRFETFLGSLSFSWDNNSLDLLSAYAWQGGWSKTANDFEWRFQCSFRATLANIFISPRFSELSLTKLHKIQIENPQLLHVHWDIAEIFKINLEDGSTPPPMPSDILDILVRMAEVEISGDSDRSMDSLSAYLSAYNQQTADEIRGWHDDAFLVIVRQYIVNVMHVIGDVDLTTSFDERLKPIYTIISATSGEIRARIKRNLLSMVINLKPWGSKAREVAVMASLAFCDKPLFKDNWEEWLVGICSGCEAILEQDHYSESDILLFMDVFRKTLDHFDSLAEAYGNGILVKGPCVALTVSAFLKFSVNFPTLSSIPLELWDNPVWNKAFTCAFKSSGDSEGSEWIQQQNMPNCIPILRSALFSASPAIQSSAIQTLSRIYWTGGLTLSEIFEETTLSGMLIVSDVSLQQPILDILCQLAQEPWFSKIFYNVEGFAWLEREITRMERCERCIQMIGFAATSAESFFELLQWAVSMRECLIRQPHIKNPQYRLIQAQKFSSILEAQQERRRVIASLPDERTPSVPHRSDDVTEDGLNPSRYDYVKAWEVSEWNDWEQFMKGVISGLKRGFIIDTRPRIILNPDGPCHWDQKNKLFGQFPLVSSVALQENEDWYGYQVEEEGSEGSDEITWGLPMQGY